MPCDGLQCVIVEYVVPGRNRFFQKYNVHLANTFTALINTNQALKIRPLSALDSAVGIFFKYSLIKNKLSNTMHSENMAYLCFTCVSLLSCQPRVTVTTCLFTIAKSNINLYTPLELA